MDCLSFVCVALCHTQLSVSQMDGCSYSELHTECLYVGTKRKENAIHYFQMLFVLNFFTINTVYSYFLTVGTAEIFLTLPFHSNADNIVLSR